MFHKIKDIAPLPEYKLSVQFSEGCTKIYDVKPLFEAIKADANDFEYDSAAKKAVSVYDRIKS